MAVKSVGPGAPSSREHPKTRVRGDFLSDDLGRLYLTYFCGGKALSLRDQLVQSSVCTSKNQTQ